MADPKPCQPSNSARGAQIASPRSSSHHRVKSSASEQTYSNSNPVLQQIKERALHAKNFYEQVGLSNGNLPRKSDVRCRLDAPPDEIAFVGGRNVFQGSKYGARWLKKTPPSSTASSPNSTNFSYTFPHKRSGSWTDMKHKAKTPDEVHHTDYQNFPNTSLAVPAAAALNNDKPTNHHTNNNQTTTQLQEAPFKSNSTSAHSVEKVKMRTRPKNKVLAKKSNSCDSIQLDHEKPAKRVQAKAASASNTGFEVSTKRVSSMEQLDKVKGADKNLASVGDIVVSTSYSSSYENITATDCSKEDSSFKTNHFDEKENHSTSQSLPPSTKHVRKKKPDLTVVAGNNMTSSLQSEELKQIDEKIPYDPANINEINNRLEIIKQTGGSGIVEIDTTDGIENRRNLQNFAHYDCQSMTFNFSRVLSAMQELKRKNVDTGASKAAAGFPVSSSGESSRANSSDNLTEEKQQEKEISPCNDLVDCCPFFINEVGGERDREISTSSIGTNASHLSNVTVQVGTHDGKSSTAKARNVLTNHDYLSIVEVVPTENPLPPGPPAQVSYGVERVDRGANYYRLYFFDKEHQNYMMNDERYGPIIISLRKEKIEDSNSGGAAVHQYRIIIRTSELTTLRGSILEDALTPRRSLGHHGLGGRSCSPRDVMEHICKEIDLNELKLAQQQAKLVEELADIDEQRIYTSYKIGVLYCRPGQTTEEEMYNNEKGSPAFDEFLQLLGRKIELQGFDQFRGGLDVKTGSTGDQSVFTEWNDYKIMFHVSTMLPFTANNPQQLLRKRHIGNDIITIVFQEPGSEPFTPKSIRSQFQHIFIIVRAVDPCSENTCYRVAVTRAKSIPRFGPSIPENCMFRKSAAFREFLLTKVVNGENIAHHTGKFKSLAMNTRQEYLKDSIRKYCTQQGLDSTDSKFGRFAFPTRRYRDRSKQNRPQPITTSCGAIVWPVIATDFNGTARVNCIFGISNCAITLIEIARNKLIFSIPCLSVLGWLLPDSQADSNMRELSLYFGRGEKITVHTEKPQDRLEIVARLERFTKGREADTCKWRGGKTLEEMGIDVNYEGIIGLTINRDQEGNEKKISTPPPDKSSPMYNVKPSSRMVEISHTSVATLSRNDIKDLLQTTKTIYCVYIAPNDDGTPTKCSMELYHLYPMPDVVHLHGSRTAALTPSSSNNNVTNENELSAVMGVETLDDVRQVGGGDGRGKRGTGRSKHPPSPKRSQTKNNMLNSSGDVGDSSTTNTLSSTKSNTSFASTTDSNRSFDQTSTPGHHRFSDVVGHNNNNNAAVIPNPASALYSRKELARKNIIYGISKHLTSPNNNHIKSAATGGGGKFSTPPSSVAAGNPQVPGGRSFLWKAPRSMSHTPPTNHEAKKATRQTSNHISSVHQNKLKTSVIQHESSRSFDLSSYQPPTSMKFDSTETTSHENPPTEVVTSPTVGASLLKSGNAAKDKRRTVNTTTSENDKSKGRIIIRNCASAPYNNNNDVSGRSTADKKSSRSAAKQKTDSSRIRSKVTYRRAATTNIMNFPKDEVTVEQEKQQHHQQQSKTPSRSVVASATSSRRNGRSGLMRANSEESILSSIESNKKYEREKHYPESMDRYIKLPLPSTGSWNEILKAATEAEKLNSPPLKPPIRDHVVPQATPIKPSHHPESYTNQKRVTTDLRMDTKSYHHHHPANERPIGVHSNPTSLARHQQHTTTTDHPTTGGAVRPKDLHRHFTKNMEAAMYAAERQPNTAAPPSQKGRSRIRVVPS